VRLILLGNDPNFDLDRRKNGSRSPCRRDLSPWSRDSDASLILNGHRSIPEASDIQSRRWLRPRQRSGDATHQALGIDMILLPLEDGDATTRRLGVSFPIRDEFDRRGSSERILSSAV
jgi:hypothetical protein